MAFVSVQIYEHSLFAKLWRTDELKLKNPAPLKQDKSSNNNKREALPGRHQRSQQLRLLQSHVHVADNA